jgi:hypothetical protein
MVLTHSLLAYSTPTPGSILSSILPSLQALKPPLVASPTLTCSLIHSLHSKESLSAAASNANLKLCSLQQQLHQDWGHMVAVVAVVADQLQRLAAVDPAFAVPMAHLTRVIQKSLATVRQCCLGQACNVLEQQQEGMEDVGVKRLHGGYRSNVEGINQQKQEVSVLFRGLLQQLILMIGPKRAQQLQLAMEKQLPGALEQAARLANKDSSRCMGVSGGLLQFSQIRCFGADLWHQLQLQQRIPAPVRLWSLLEQQVPAEQVVLVWGDTTTSALQAVAAAAGVRPGNNATTAADSDSDGDEYGNGNGVFGVDDDRRGEAAQISSRDEEKSSAGPWSKLRVVRLPWNGGNGGITPKGSSSSSNQYEMGSCSNGRNSNLVPRIENGRRGDCVNGSCSSWPCGSRAAVQAAAAEGQLLVVVINHWGTAAADQLGDLIVMAAQQVEMQKAADGKLTGLSAAGTIIMQGHVLGPLNRPLGGIAAAGNGASGRSGFRMVVVVPNMWLEQVWCATGCTLLPCCQEMLSLGQMLQQWGGMDSNAPSNSSSINIDSTARNCSSGSSGDICRRSVPSDSRLSLFPSGQKVAWLLSWMLQHGPWPDSKNTFASSQQGAQLHPLTLSKVLQPLALAVATAWLETLTATEQDVMTTEDGKEERGVERRPGWSSLLELPLGLPGPLDLQHLQLLLHQACTSAIVAEASSSTGRTTSQQDGGQVLRLQLEVKQLEQLLQWAVLQPECCSRAQQQYSSQALSRCLAAESLGLKPVVGACCGTVGLRQEVVADLEDEYKEMQWLLVQQQRRQQQLRLQGHSRSLVAGRAEMCWLMLQEMADHMGWVVLPGRMGRGIGSRAGQGDCSSWLDGPGDDVGEAEQGCSDSDDDKSALSGGSSEEDEGGYKAEVLCSAGMVADAKSPGMVAVKGSSRGTSSVPVGVALDQVSLWQLLLMRAGMSE